MRPPRSRRSLPPEVLMRPLIVATLATLALAATPAVAGPFDTLQAPAPPGPAGPDARLYPPSEGAGVPAAAWGRGGGGTPLGAPRRTVLKNGLTLLVLEDRRMPLAALSLHLKGGSGSDEPGKEGRASMRGRARRVFAGRITLAEALAGAEA